MGSYDGYHDYATCAFTGGWTCNKTFPNGFFNVQIYAGPVGGLPQTLLGETRADELREAAVGTACGDTSNPYHGFTFPNPKVCTNCTDYQTQVDNYNALKDGVAHDIRAYRVRPDHQGSGWWINNTPITITCPAPTPTPFPCPANINQSCNGSGTQATISWDAIAAAVGYVLRLNHEPYDAPTNWYNAGQGDQWQEPTSSTINVAITPGANYQYSVQGKAPGESYPYAGGRCPYAIFNCPAPTPTAIPTPVGTIKAAPCG